jgi:hypothetical protein
VSRFERVAMVRQSSGKEAPDPEAGGGAHPLDPAEASTRVWVSTEIFPVEVVCRACEHLSDRYALWLFSMDEGVSIEVTSRSGDLEPTGVQWEVSRLLVDLALGATRSGDDLPLADDPDALARAGPDWASPPGVPGIAPGTGDPDPPIALFEPELLLSESAAGRLVPLGDPPECLEAAPLALESLGGRPVSSDTTPEHLEPTPLVPQPKRQRPALITTCPHCGERYPLLRGGAGMLETGLPPGLTRFPATPDHPPPHAEAEPERLLSTGPAPFATLAHEPKRPVTGGLMPRSRPVPEPSAWPRGRMLVAGAGAAAVLVLAAFVAARWDERWVRSRDALFAAGAGVQGAPAAAEPRGLETTASWVPDPSVAPTGARRPRLAPSSALEPSRGPSPGPAVAVTALAPAASSAPASTAVPAGADPAPAATAAFQPPEAGSRGEEALGHVRRMLELAGDAGGFAHESEILAERAALETLPRPAARDRAAARAGNARALHLLQQRRPAEAAVALQDAHALDPGDVEVLNNLAHARLLTGDLAAAEAALLEALALAPGRGPAWANLAQVYLRRGDEHAALAGLVQSYRFSRDPAKTDKFLAGLIRAEPEPRRKALLEQARRLGQSRLVAASEGR